MTHNLNAIKDALGHCASRTTLDYIVTPDGTLKRDSEMVADYWDNALTVDNLDDILNQFPTELLIDEDSLFYCPHFYEQGVKLRILFIIQIFVILYKNKF